MKSSFLETIKSLDGEIFHIEYHQKRYENVLKSYGVTEFKNLKDYLNPPPFGLYRCRLVYTSESIDISYYEYKKKDIYSFKILFDNEIDYSFKAEDREHIDTLYAQKDEADEILIVKDLQITDTSIANVAFYREGEWITPKNPLLKGTTRERLLSEGKIVEKEIGVQELRSFSKVALMNAMVDFYVLDEYEFLL